MAFRKIDVDSIEEDFFREADFLPADAAFALSPDEAQSLAQTTAGEPMSVPVCCEGSPSYLTFLRAFASGDPKAALVKALTSPVYGSGEHLDAAKAIAGKTVIDILSATKSTEAASIVATLTSEQRDWLLKYLYRGFAHPESVNCATLLTWHEKLVEVAGSGAIIRVLTDRRTV
ncbi:ARP2/3 complex 16 kDa subunit (p16-Arc)-domain-containing protein [Syncephalis pseudoplumigaleata]|uniref:Actin-related protein 2/3 complex subunit 5 n=1 Tax=Syncephalis pseudoplumigaleata TaxID=1712513 RepID=A0A4P9Z4W2_9FUNG|nr:ARP2/3 complex 16 kDa subunit (p16-Arc)-domain-containing protein [Syncephalis pseudoplumigaleata]|eukprot:RKP27637.1 ARP2/3 complex 16 kDa subunit (p16-Arc)-domain-containing protein [Syncephalis pseudoplumigaleata]